MEWYLYDFIGVVKKFYWYYFNTLNFEYISKIKKSQTIIRKPINNPVQGRCY